MILRSVSALGIAVFVLVAWLCSSDRRSVSWRTVSWALLLEAVLAFLIFRWPLSRQLFIWLNKAALALLGVSQEGALYLFGPLAKAPGEAGSVGFILAFQVLPVVIFFSAFTSVLYHLRLLAPVVKLFARFFRRVMGLSGAESLYGASNIFVGIEAALVVRPYLERMTRSEFLAILASGMATVASSTLGIYVGFLSGVFPNIAGHLLSASVLAIPASFLIAKIMIPETAIPETMGRVPEADPGLKSGNLMGAIIQGSTDGLKLAASIAGLLIAMLGLIALVDKLLALPLVWFPEIQPLSLTRILSWIFLPFAYLLGIAPADISRVSELLAQRVILTEVFAYRELARLVTSGEWADPRTVTVMSYALCGFAHVPSMAIFVGGIQALAPSRRDELAGLGVKALLAATLATLVTACIAGIFMGQESLLMPART